MTAVAAGVFGLRRGKPGRSKGFSGVTGAIGREIALPESCTRAGFGG
jgi:hypothetical protein